MIVMHACMQVILRFFVREYEKFPLIDMTRTGKSNRKHIFRYIVTHDTILNARYGSRRYIFLLTVRFAMCKHRYGGGGGGTEKEGYSSHLLGVKNAFLVLLPIRCFV